MFTYMVPIESLRAIDLFSGCNDKLLRKLSRLGTEVHAKARQVLAREGDVGREFYVIVDGSATVQHAGDEIATLQRGDFFGEMALIDGRARSATVIAASPMRLFVFDPREFFSLLDEFPPISRKILSTIAGRIRETQDRTGAEAEEAGA